MGLSPGLALSAMPLHSSTSPVCALHVRPSSGCQTLPLRPHQGASPQCPLDSIHSCAHGSMLCFCVSML